MSDERDRAGSASDGSDGSDKDDTRDGQTTVVTRPQRPTGKRSRRGAADEDGGEAVDLATGDKAVPTKNGTAKKTAKKGADGPSRNPFTYVWEFLTQVVAELRKVIWPNRKQMVTYTTVVLIFLAFMVTMIGLVDFGLVKLVTLVLGN